VRLDESPADEQAEPGARDARLAHVPGPVERFRDEIPFRLRHADPLVVDRHRQPRPVDRGTEHDRAAVRRVLARVADEVREHLADAPHVRVERRQVGRGGNDDALGTARDIELAAQPRDERIEGRRRSLEDQRVGLEVRDVEHLVDERGEPTAGLVDALDVGSQLSGLELEMEERFGVAADERQRGAQLMADRGDEPLAQLLERLHRAEVAQDRGRARARAGGRRRRSVRAGDADRGAGTAPDGRLAIGDRVARRADLGQRAFLGAVTAGDLAPEHVRARPTEGLRSGDPEQPLPGRVQAHDVILGIDLEDEIGRAVDDGFELAALILERLA